MRIAPAFLAVAACWPFAAGAQVVDAKDWQLVCDNVHACRAAGYSAAGAGAPVSVLFSRAAGAGQPVAVALQLGTLDPRSVHPASVTLLVAGKPAGTIRVDRDNHADLAAPVAAALLKAAVGGSPVAFTAGKAAWRLSTDGAVEALGGMDEVQGRAGHPSALVHRGTLGDADVVLPMSVPRFEAGNIGDPHRPGDEALVVQVLSAVQSVPECPLLDDGQAQAAARLWHLDANRLLVSQPCKAAADGGGLGYWLANLRPPHDARAMTYAGLAFDAANSTIHAHALAAPGGDCGTTQAWTWNGFRFEPSYSAVGGLCRGVKAGGAWVLPTLVSDVVPGQ